MTDSETDYEDLLSLWSDLEAGLGVVLGCPENVQEFQPRVLQYDRWMQDLLKRNTDVGLYLLFQLSSHSSVGYSTSHALICCVLCHLIAADLGLSPAERNSLVHAAMTMNIAMTALQDRLALQTEKLSSEQREAVRRHAIEGADLLARLGIDDALWIEIVALHHVERGDKVALADLGPGPGPRLAHILRNVDRYAAMISPRKSREARSVIESIRKIMSGSAGNNNEVGQSLVRVVGTYPPGTCVKLENNTLAVVLRRSAQPNLPDVAIVSNRNGELLPDPRRHSTAHGRPGIQNAVGGAMARMRLNHARILELGQPLGEAD